MKKIKKKIFNIKIQKIIQKYNFVLFFTYNNLKNKQYIFLKNMFYNKQKNYASILVCNNKYFYNYIKKNEKILYNKIKKKKYLKINKNFYSIFCSGPTLLFFFNDINECENILYFLKNKITLKVNKFALEKKAKYINNYENEKKQKNIQKIPNIFIEKKKIFFFFSNNENLNLPYLFFVGGIYKNTFINYLDLKKLHTLNKNVYNTLIIVYYENIKNFIYICNNIKFNLYILIFTLYKFLNTLHFIKNLPLH